jgi:maltooligosyltrehalose trehalohydrolase
MTTQQLDLGGALRPDGSTSFQIWAPKSETVELHLVDPTDQIVPMRRNDRGYWSVVVDSAPAGARYYFRHDREHDWPDPASRSQPDGVHGASEVIDPTNFEWSTDQWIAPSIDDYVIYEVHIGTLTREGTFDAAIYQLDRLVELGITAIEIMPVAEFPGTRNWGYDGAYPFAADSSYGGPSALARLVDECHRRGMAVILDVVYNHFGPEGAYQGAYGHYFTDKYRTPWGAAVNFDGPESDEVRRYFIESARYWLRDLRIDSFRLDAVHAIYDQSAYPFLRQFTDEIHRAAREIGRTAYLIAESDLNDPRMILPAELGGFGFDAQWSDDVHHALHARLTSERSGYYVDFGSTRDLKRAFQCGYVYTGQYSAHRQCSHGAVPRMVSPERFIVFSQNHDQVGNRATGDRLTSQLTLEQLKLAAATIVLSPFVPLLFMGEEYGELTPFQYFTGHTDPGLIEGVRRGRAEEFKAFTWSGDVPDPQDDATFERSKLQLGRQTSDDATSLEAFYKRLIELRRTIPALKHPAFERQEVELAGDDEVLMLRRWNEGDTALIILNFSDRQQIIRLVGQDETWSTLLSSNGSAWSEAAAEDRRSGHVVSGQSLSIGPFATLLLRMEPLEQPK